MGFMARMLVDYQSSEDESVEDDGAPDGPHDPDDAAAPALDHLGTDDDEDDLHATCSLHRRDASLWHDAFTVVLTYIYIRPSGAADI